MQNDLFSYHDRWDVYVFHKYVRYRMYRCLLSCQITCHRSVMTYLDQQGQETTHIIVFVDEAVLNLQAKWWATFDTPNKDQGHFSVQTTISEILFRTDLSYYVLVLTPDTPRATSLGKGVLCLKEKQCTIHLNKVFFYSILFYSILFYSILLPEPHSSFQFFSAWR